jgi:zinc protease
MAKAKAPKKSVKRVTLPGITFVRELGGISEYRLESNGLQILLAPDATVPVVGVMVTYHVGSRNETIGHTGATHLLEHLLFKGSKKFNKSKGNDVWMLLEEKGALVNANTWYDRTTYYEVIPAEFTATALAFEADRMRYAFIREDDRQSEMPVVRNEFERGENHPTQALDKQIWASAFIAHPYHHETIGWKSDIEGVSIERLQQFYNDFYYPDNATLTLVGGFNPEKMLTEVVKSFGPLPRQKTARPAIYTAEPKQEGQRRVVVKRAGATNVVGVAHKIPEAVHEDQYALFILSLILADGKTSRFYRAFIDTAKAIEADSIAYQLRDPSLFVSYVKPAPGVTHQEVEKMILAEYTKIAKTGVTTKELASAKQSVRSYLAARRDGPYAFLGGITEDIASGDWTRYVTTPESLAKVTAKEVQKVAQKYFVDESSTVGYFIGTGL